MTLLNPLRALLATLLFCFSLSVTAAPPAIDLNTASAKEIATTLSGIGIKKALAILDYRTLNGPFVRIDDLVKVKGIGAATLNKNRHLMMVGVESKVQPKQ